MKCRDCKFYNNRESNDFGRTRLSRCTKSGYASMAFENSLEENMSIESLLEQCPLDCVTRLRYDVNKVKVLLSKADYNGIEPVLSRMLDLINKL